MAKRVKDNVCGIELCSIELKLKISENLCSKQLAKLECVNSAWQQLLNNNDWWWKNKCFSDDLWLKMRKNDIYTRCVRWQLIYNKNMRIHVDYYDDKVWEQFCNQVKNAADKFNHVETLPEGCTWKELYNLWDIAEKHEEAYLDCMFAKQVHQKELKCFASFVSYLHTSEIIETRPEKSDVVAWDDIRQPSYGYDDSYTVLLDHTLKYELCNDLLDHEQNWELDSDFDEFDELGNELGDVEQDWESKWEPDWDSE